MKANIQQKEAIETIEGNLLLLAGAGTGKTATLVERTANMLKQGIRPESILLLTFTNKAAKEMKSRIMDKVGEGEKITATTFHSFCYRFLIQHMYYLKEVGYHTKIQIIDGGEQGDIIRTIRDKKIKEMRYGKFPSRKILTDLYSASINARVSYTDICKKCRAIKGYERECVEVLREYDQYKRDRQYMDFDDLLYWTIYILENHENVRRRMDHTYKYIMCDEYQDTNVIQDYLLDLLCRDISNLAVVGDDNQSIYRFRGAHIENILTFPDRHEGCRVIKLEENYRSTQEILDVSNEMMKHARVGYPKRLHGQVHGETVRIQSYQRETDLLDDIMSIIENRDCELKDIAVIVRSSYQSNRLELRLNREGIPFKKFGGKGFFEKKVVRDVLSYLRVAEDDGDVLAWLRLLQLYPGIGPAKAEYISDILGKNGVEEIEESMTFRTEKYYQTLQGIHDLILDLRKRRLLDQIDTVLNVYNDHQKSQITKKRNGSRLEEELAELEHGMQEATMLLEFAKDYDTTKEFLDDVVLNASAEKDADDYLNITTIHSAKGLEYNTVILLDPVEEEYHRRDESEEEEDETLRCLYVALTRAKERMYLMMNEAKNGKVYYLTRELDKKSVLNTMAREEKS